MHTDERDFNEVVQELSQKLRKPYGDDLLLQVQMFPEASKWIYLTHFIVTAVDPDASDPYSVEIYSILNGKSPEEMRKLLAYRALQAS